MPATGPKPIVIAEYDARWPALFEAERGLIYQTCGASPFAAIEHVGSTSVPGLAAKPVIDILAELHSLSDAAALTPKLETIGYVYKAWTEEPSPEFGDPGTPFRRYFTKDVNGRRAYQIHMLERTHEWGKRLTRFRDYLRLHPEAARTYAELKRDLAGKYNAALTPASNINSGYTNFKTDFVMACLRAEEAERGSR